MTYSTINDAANTSSTLAAATGTGIKVWYAKREPADWNSEGFKYPPRVDLGMGLDFLQEHRPELIPTVETLSQNHVLLGTVKGDEDFSNDWAEEYKEDVFHAIFAALQGLNWSPRGEANELIKGLWASHTSMSVGDVLQAGEDLYMVDNVGFRKL